jgi:hypothetical protein
MGSVYSKLRLLLSGLLAFMLMSTVAPLGAQTTSGVADALTSNAGLSTTKALAKEIQDNSQLMKNLEELCDDFGARITGSESLLRSQEWAMKKLISYGAVNVHREAYDIGKPWIRGRASARLLNANQATLDVAQQAWTQGSKGKIKADVAILDAKNLDDFIKVAPSLKGKIVLVLNEPNLQARPGKDTKADLERLKKAIIDAKFSAVLRVSEKADSLQDMFGSLGSRYTSNVGIITSDHANLLQRLIKRGITPKLEMEFTGGFGKHNVNAYNVVADFPGSDLSQEMVIVGAHIDSWDLASGATDNGAGVVVAMEVLRSMHALNVKPKRSLRVVLFSGEEQGLWGSRAYRIAHQDELKNVQAMLNHDAGAGRIIGFPDMKVDAWFDALSKAFVPVKEIGELDIQYGISRGSDQASFFEAGVPAFSAIQTPMNYFTHTQHSPFDNFDRVSEANLVYNAKIMSAVAWSLLNAERIPHLEVKPAK